MKTKPMHEIALSLLKRRKAITKAQFFAVTGSCNLNEYISRLRQSGYIILTVKPDNKKRCTYQLLK